MARTTNPWILGAGAAGLVHAAFSLHWALGGTWLLSTVGEWATDWVDRSPALASSVLLAVACLKVAGALIPLAVESGRMGARGWWRGVSALGAVVLVAYGTVNSVVAWMVLAGLVDAGATDDRALLGHALLWDPLFALWGGLLAVGLWQTRAGRQADLPELAGSGH